MGKQMARDPELGSFSLSWTNDPNSDSIFFTFGVPKIIDLPYLGHASIQSISVAAATIIVPWLCWLGRRKVKQIKQHIRERRERREEEEDNTAESPVKAKKWESNPGGKLDDFMSEVRANKEQLRNVEDPDTAEKRMAKREKIVMEQKKKPKGKLGLTEDLLQGTRSGLKQASSAHTDAALSPRSNQSNIKSKEIEKHSIANNNLLQDARMGLRKASTNNDASLLSTYLEKDSRSIHNGITALETNLEREIEEHTKQLNRSDHHKDDDDKGGADQASKCIIS